MNKNIAVLIPTFKPDWYLNRCLQSLKNQSISKKSFKIYLALNGPKENFESAVLKSIEATGLNYDYCYIEKKGVSHARNFLIDRSVEDYIVFIDDDDLVSRTYLEALYHASSKTCMGISNTYNFESDLAKLKTNFIGRSFPKLDKEEQSKYKTRKYFSSPWAKMLHREMIGSTRFDTNLSKGEDSLFMANLSKNIVSLKKSDNDACYYVYERPGSATRSKHNMKDEVKRTRYLIKKYIEMAASDKYNRIFIATRIAATLKNMRIFP